jgi:hypothetical protein
MIEQPVAQRIGEVIEASTISWVSGAYRLLDAPPFGSLVRANCHEVGLSIYGLVYDIRTGSREPGGRAMVRGGRRYDGQEFYDGAIYAEHPDLAAVLQTEFSALIVGYDRADRLVHYLPPQPPTVHYSVYTCDSLTVQRFTTSCDFFRMVLSTNVAPADDLLGTAIRLAARLQPDRQAYEVCAGREERRCCVRRPAGAIGMSVARQPTQKAPGCWLHP